VGRVYGDRNEKERKWNGHRKEKIKVECSRKRWRKQPQNSAKKILKIACHIKFFKHNP